VEPDSIHRPASVQFHHIVMHLKNQDKKLRMAGFIKTESG
jgi:hypothetical protein